MNTCEFCQFEFEPTRKGHRYCSTACNNQALYHANKVPRPRLGIIRSSTRLIDITSSSAEWAFTKGELLAMRMATT